VEFSGAESEQERLLLEEVWTVRFGRQEFAVPASRQNLRPKRMHIVHS